VAVVAGSRAHLLTREALQGTASAEALPHLSPIRILDRIRLIARTVEDEPGLTSRELAERVGFGRRQMSLVLLRLEERGHVVHEGRRWFPRTRARDRRAAARRGPSGAIRRSARDPAKSRNLH
jgi:hypothetical protein